MQDYYKAEVAQFVDVVLRCMKAITLFYSKGYKYISIFLTIRWSAFSSFFLNFSFAFHSSQWPTELYFGKYSLGLLGCDMGVDIPNVSRSMRRLH